MMREEYIELITQYINEISDIELLIFYIHIYKIYSIIERIEVSYMYKKSVIDLINTLEEEKDNRFLFQILVILREHIAKQKK